MKKILFLFSIIGTVSFADDIRISSQLEKDLSEKQTVELYVLLKNHNKTNTYKSSNFLEKRQNHIRFLRENSTYSRQQIEQTLKNFTENYKFYWINNSLWARMESSKAREFLKSEFIEKAYSDEKQKLKLPNPEPETKQIQATEWGIDKVNAPDVWALGITGQGILIAGQDTGYQWDHPAIKDKYAGWDGVNVDHNYHWHDSINNPNNVCEDTQNNPASCDDHGHGTHTMGTMVGDDGTGNQVGVAPGAKWIGCRNMNQGDGHPSTYAECFQFFLAPTDLNNQNPDVSKAPHVINNSWGCPESEGCTQPDVLETVVNNVVDAGILVVASAGNSGSGCNSVNTPIAIYDNTLTIGSTQSDDTISGFSSRGGVAIDGSNRLKPDLVAPGSSVRSARLGGGYTTMSGTSMASPHVAGVAALMMSANPDMIGNPKILKRVLQRTTAQLTTTSQSCSGVSGSEVPNNTFGYGRIDALAAVNMIQDIIYLDNFEDF